jgi:predicted RNase H-like HicB family nuclease
MTDLWERAERLAARPYTTEVVRDESTDGEPMFLARHPELPGCQAQGETVDEALHNLNGARLDFIYFLLEDGLPVPEPAGPVATASTGRADTSPIELRWSAGEGKVSEKPQHHRHTHIEDYFLQHP